MEELDLGAINPEDLQSAIDNLQVDGLPEIEVSTDSPEQPEPAPQPSTEGQDDQFKIPERRYDEPGLGGFVKSVAVGTAEDLAPIVGVSDTIIDTINLIPGVDLPKVPEYESNTTQALRNISGLIIPSLGLRAKLLSWGSKAHKAGTAAPWLQKLGNSRSFQYFSKFGADIGTAGLVDYVAEQNQKDDNFFGVLKGYWPQTFQWIPNSIATNADDTPGEKRLKNVNEGAIFGVLSSIVEGVAYLTGAGRSLKRTSKFVPSKEGGISSKELNARTSDEFDATKFSDKPVEDQVLRGYARN